MNIEKTISEHAVSDILTPMLESQDRIVTEDVAPLFNEATGLDTPPASGTVTTTIEESRSVITAIIRKAWTATLTMLGGASVIGYITAAYTYLRNRLKGNETYGIPDRRSEISASSPLAANLALLNDRKIGGVPEAEDGMSLVHLLCDNAATKLVDDNRGWTMSRAFPWSSFPSLQDIVFGFSHISITLLSNNTSIKSIGFTVPFTCNNQQILNNVDIEGEFVCPISGVITYNQSMQSPTFYKLNKVTKAKFPNLKGLNINYGIYDGLISSCPLLEEVEATAMTSCETADTNHKHLVIGCTALKKIVLGTFTSPLYDWKVLSIQYDSYPNLIHFEIGEGTAVNISLSYWSPTLDSSNLQQFLSNFRDYIANRLTDNGSGKTLTLSQAVRNAIHAAEATYGIENIIITQKGWTISPAPN